MADATYQPKVYKKDGGDTLVVASGGTLSVESGAIVTNAGTQSFSGNATTGVMVSKSVRFVENGAATSYTGTIPVPAGAVVHSIKLIAEVLWNGTSASAKVGDTADDDGYFIGVNLKATDLLVNEVLETNNDALWGGKEGAYLVAASGRRGPTTTNFGMYYAAGSNITCIVTPGAADGSAGRTVFAVTYSVGEVITQVTV
jgi:hypothetical protein